MKRCSRCRETKPVEAFSKNRRQGDGLQTFCKPCQAETFTEWRIANSTRFNALVMTWHKAHPEARRAMSSLRRARKAAATVTRFTAAELAASYAARGLTCCVYCGGAYEHDDHVIPLARGGPHCIENLVPACGPCNLSKGAKLLAEWPGRVDKSLLSE